MHSHRVRSIAPCSAVSKPVRLALLAAAIASSACGGDSAASGDSAGSTATASAGAAAAADATDGGAATFTEADLDGLERGLAREAEAVRAAQELGRNAKTPAERGAAAQAAYDMATIPEGAKAAGMDEARYRQVRTTVHEVLQTLDFQGKIDGPLSVDTARIGAEMKAKLAADPLAALAPASAAVLRARLDRLVAVWSDYMRLVAVAG